MGYELLRTMKIQVAPGKVELRQPGDPCPEAEKWPNPAAWVRRGYLKQTDTAAMPAYDRSKLVPARKAKPEDADRGKNPPSASDGAATVAEKPAAAEPVDEQVAELMALSRSDLNALAAEHGIAEPAKLAKKEAVAKAILEAQG